MIVIVNNNNKGEVLKKSKRKNGSNDEYEYDEMYGSLCSWSDGRDGEKV